MKLPERVWVCRYMYTYSCGCILTAKEGALMKERCSFEVYMARNPGCKTCPGPVMFERKAK